MSKFVQVLVMLIIFMFAAAQAKGTEQQEHLSFGEFG